MNVVDIIIRKRNGESLNREEISWILREYTTGKIPEYQMAAILMCIYFRGMKEKELLTFTKEMLHSGKTLDLDNIKGPKIDKHSTGGVGDKVSLIVVPLVASAGVIVPMIAGRGLGHTGGTIDKLESIPGLRTEIPLEEFKEIIKKTGAGIIVQSDEIVPADKKLYALRDVTGTVESIPLIAASIMSKKLAAGSDGIVIDVKVGSGAFMKNIKAAKELARTLVWIGKSMSKETIAILSDMNVPLGRAIGNSLEVQEAIEVLRGKGESRLVDLCIEISAWMLKLSGKVKSLDVGRDIALNLLKRGDGLEKFREIIKIQGGDYSICDNINKIPVANKRFEFKAIRSGYIERIDARAVGEATRMLGAGREKLGDKIDHSVGIYLSKTIGEYVKEGEPIAIFYYNDEERLNIAVERLTGAINYSKIKPSKRSIIYGIIG